MLPQQGQHFRTQHDETCLTFPVFALFLPPVFQGTGLDSFVREALHSYFNEYFPGVQIHPRPLDAQHLAAALALGGGDAVSRVEVIIPGVLVEREELLPGPDRHIVLVIVSVQFVRVVGVNQVDGKALLEICRVLSDVFEIDSVSNMAWRTT